MSTNYLGEKNNYLSGEGSILSLVVKSPSEPAPETVSEYVQRIASAKGLSHVKIARAAKAKGYDLSSSTVNALMQNLVKSHRVETLQAVAAGLGEPEDDIFDRARGKQPSDDEDYKKSTWSTLARDYSKVPEAKRPEIGPYIEVLKLEIQKRLR